MTPSLINYRAMLTNLVLPRALSMLATVSILCACQEHSEQPEALNHADSTQLLRDLADEIWADTLENSTYLRLQEGLPIEKFEDLTLENHHENLAKAAAWQKTLSLIDSTALSGDDLITYEILDFELAPAGVNDDDYWLQFDITAYVGPYLFRFTQQALAIHRFPDAAAADHYLNLANEYADMIDQLVVKTEGQVERGVYLPKPALESTRATWAGIRETAPQQLSVSEGRLAALTGEERQAFSAALDRIIQDRVLTGFDHLLARIGADYEVQAPDEVGLHQYRGGSEVYLRRIRRNTTLELSPEQIHKRGKKAVSEISARMQAIRDNLGFEGGAQEFNDQIRKDPRFLAESPQEVEDRFMEYIKRIEPKLDVYFRSQPKAAYGVRRLPPAAEAGMTYGFYSQPTADDPVGYYNYNASDLPNRSLVWAGSLIYHELLPGHHFHLATQGENEALLDYRKKYSVGAFTEGWAEYAASLGIQMGVYETPEELYGRYIGEIFLASRLVVDTGMNALGWSLQDARDYMHQYVIQSDSEIASETLRYSTSIPAQALAYRLGYEKMWELRHRAEEALGNAFDIRDYHEVVLADGAKPLAVLEAKVDRYIASALQD